MSHGALKITNHKLRTVSVQCTLCDSNTSINWFQKVRSVRFFGERKKTETTNYKTITRPPPPKKKTYGSRENAYSKMNL